MPIATGYGTITNVIATTSTLRVDEWNDNDKVPGVHELLFSSDALESSDLVDLTDTFSSGDYVEFKARVDGRGAITCTSLKMVVPAPCTGYIECAGIISAQWAVDVQSGHRDPD